MLRTQKIRPDPQNGQDPNPLSTKQELCIEEKKAEKPTDSWKWPFVVGKAICRRKVLSRNF